MVLSDGGTGGTPVREDIARVTESIFSDLSNRVEACFDAVSLADVCLRAKQQGLRRPTTERYSYVI